MSKTWDKMTPEEKIEDLRRDVTTLFDAYNDLNRRLSAEGQHLGQAVTTANEAAREVAALKARLDSGQVAEEAAREMAHGLEQAARSLPPSF